MFFLEFVFPFTLEITFLLKNSYFVLNTLTAKGFSQTGPFMHLSNHVFQSQ